MIDALTKRDSVFDSLNLMCSALTLSAFDMQTTHAHAVEMIRTSIQAEAGYILLVENEELAFAAAFSLDMEKLRSIKIRKGVGIAGFVRDRGTPVIVHDAAEHPNFSPLLDKETGFVTKSILSVPIISQGRITGVMEVLNKTHGSFDESDEKMLQSIATAVSVAMENAQLYQDALQTTRKVQPA
jgi:GAF domain-containing protein